MKVSVIGLECWGSVTAACFTEIGHEVVCVGIDENKIKK
jgi:UDPglucose 6-dehydrogenase